MSAEIFWIVSPKRNFSHPLTNQEFDAITWEWASSVTQ